MTAIRVRGIGPHTDTRLTLNPEGVTTLRGGSGAGKSTILHAVACALWGTDATGAAFDRALLSDDRGSVAYGSYGRTIPQRGEHVRLVVVDGAPQPGGTEAQFGATLPAAYRDAQAARLVMFPDTLWSLLDSAQGGGALRAVLDRMLPGPTAADLLADLPAAAPRDEKAAAKLVTETRRASTAARARADALRSAIPAAPTLDRPTDEAVAEARATLDRTAALRADLDAWRDEDATHRSASLAVSSWLARAASLVEPEVREPTAAELVDAEDAAKAEDAAERDYRQAFGVYHAAANARRLAEHAAAEWERRRALVGDPPAQPRPAAEDVRAAMEAIRGAELWQDPQPPLMPRDWTPPEEPSPCPGSPAGCGWAARAAERRAERIEQHAAAWAAYDARMLCRPSDPADAREVVALDEAWGAFERALDRLGPQPTIPADPGPEPVEPPHTARAALQTLQAADLAWRTYRIQRNALGDRPADPAPLRPRPEVDAAAVNAAQDVIRAHEAAAIRLQAHEEQERRAIAAYRQAEHDASDAEAITTAAEGWLEAVRTAPARALANKLALLEGGDLLIADDDGKTKVTIRGRPWYLASHGERIAAVAHWRVRLRDAAGLGALPVFIDDVTSVGGIPLPDAPGVVLLVTTAGAFEAA